jgi:predicted nucleotidyltransferase
MDIYELISVKRDEILSLAERFGIKNIRVFGSVARHEAHDRSDIDFLVEFPPGASLLTHAAFQRELSVLLSRDVDVASVKGLKNQSAQLSCRKRSLYEIRY